MWGPQKSNAKSNNDYGVDLVSSLDTLNESMPYGADV